MTFQFCIAFIKTCVDYRTTNIDARYKRGHKIQGIFVRATPDISGTVDSGQRNQQTRPGAGDGMEARLFIFPYIILYYLFVLYGARLLPGASLDILCKIPS